MSQAGGGGAPTGAEMTEALYSQAPVGMALLDLELRFAHVNKRFAEMSGRPAAEHIGRRAEEILGARGEDLSATAKRALEDGVLVAHEFDGRLSSSAQAPRYWKANAQIIIQDGRPAGIGVVIVDISERRRSEIGAAFLARASEILDSSLDYGQTLRSVARLAVPEVGDWCSISMFDERGRMKRVAVAHPDPAKDRLAQELIEREELRLDAPAGAGRAVLSARTQLIADFPDRLLDESLRDEPSRRIIRELGIGSSLSVPLIARGQTIGAISMIGEHPGRFDAEDVRLVEALAARAAINIDNARLYTAHARIARTLQAGLLPRPVPLIPGAEVAARYRAAGELVEVGGDFYDIYLRPVGSWLIAMGDVTGKGAEAAATTALVRYTLRAAAQHRGGPADLLRELNSSMLAQDADYCTIGLAAIAPAGDGTVDATVCLAGHPPPIRIGPGGDTEVVGRHGTLLGYDSNPEFQETSLRLGAGEVLLLYTDGLTDAGAPPTLSPAELAGTLAGPPGESLEDLLARVEVDAIKRAGGQPRDDIAILAIRGRRES